MAYYGYRKPGRIRIVCERFWDITSEIGFRRMTYHDSRLLLDEMKERMLVTPTRKRKKVLGEIREDTYHLIASDHLAMDDGLDFLDHMGRLACYQKAAER